MEKLYILGTGHAMVTKCYNTCFTIFNGDEHFLVDAGGGNTILANLQKLDISIEKIKHIFISHKHIDHLLGCIWIIRAFASRIMKNKNSAAELNIYACQDVIKIINAIVENTLDKKQTATLKDCVTYYKIEDNCNHHILNWYVEFFDIHSKKEKQFGFRINLRNNKKLTFLGDEPYYEESYEYANNSDYLLHEAFCLFSQREIFQPYEKHHATVKEACENARKLNAKNLILYHTEDDNILERKKLYRQEGKNFYSGKIMVPNDLEIIELV
ncbi:MAG: MBL fold metallo-hydrolase [Peptococcaceae bacterium]